MARAIKEIAIEISEKWENISPHAFPYLEAMSTLNSIQDDYYADSARSVVLYFLSNARGFKGEDARRLKDELKALL